jgi:lycopene beta-cyclase
MSAVTPPAAEAFDVVVVGGGLAGGLVALALAKRAPRLRIALCEAGDRLGGNHTWCCFGSDLGGDRDEELLAALVVKRWSSCEVRFSDHTRVLTSSYAAVTADALDRAVRPVLARPNCRLFLGARAVQVGAHDVVLDSGARLSAPLVLDARGPAAPPRWVENQGFQKFLGLEIEVAGQAPLPPDRALVMDADLAQADGFRFMYVLPLAPNRLLVEDTYFSDSPALERPLLRARVHAYLEQRQITPARVVREEAGVLSLPWSDDSLPPLGSPVRLGARGGWFHPTTGYTLATGLKVAHTIADAGPERAPAALARLYRQLAPQAAYARRLNHLLFRATPPEHRWQVLSRFYRLPQPAIERFYALATTPLDRARLFFGRPPRGVSLGAAFRSFQTLQSRT